VRASTFFILALLHRSSCSCTVYHVYPHLLLQSCSTAHPCKGVNYFFFCIAFSIHHIEKCLDKADLNEICIYILCQYLYMKGIHPGTYSAHTSWKLIQIIWTDRHDLSIKHSSFALCAKNALKTDSLSKINLICPFSYMIHWCRVYISLFHTHTKSN